MSACDRKGCNNVMCERFSHEYGYICWECFNELVLSGPETNIGVFMNTTKKANRKEAAQARFNVEFPLMNKDY